MLEKISSEKKREEVLSVLKDNNASRHRRVWLIGFLKNAIKLTENEVLKLIKENNCWLNYNETITKKNVNWFFKNKKSDISFLHEKKENIDIVKKKNILDNYIVKKENNRICKFGKFNGYEGPIWKEWIFESEATHKQKEESNMRSVRINEIFLDFDDESLFEKAQLKFLESEFNYYSYRTQRGGHIHLFFDDEVTDEQRKKIVKTFGASHTNWNCAKEDKIHWKSGKLKEQIKSREGLNSVDLLEEESLC